MTGAELLYARRLDLYKSTKPYLITFDVAGLGSDVPQSNLHLAPSDTSFCNIRTSGKDFKLGVNGFEVRHLPSSLSVEEFQDEDSVRLKYFPEIKALIREVLGSEVEEILFLNSKVRRPALFLFLLFSFFSPFRSGRFSAGGLIYSRLWVFFEQSVPPEEPAIPSPRAGRDPSSAARGKSSCRWVAPIIKPPANLHFSRVTRGKRVTLECSSRVYDPTP